MLLPILTTLFLQFQGLSAQAVDANGITLEEKKEALERQMLDPFTLVSLVNPCNINFGADPNEGEQTSAEWVRIVFHDMITANIEGPGLGGLDASISFESDRPENIGVFVNVTIGQFSQFSSVFLSMADLIGVGLSDSLATCDLSARRIPLRVGRIDATHAGPAGVPEPTTSVQDTIDTFALAGLNQTEMIQAIACGHSLGGVHHTNFPDIVPDLQDPTNLHGRSTFDSTPAVFDNTGVTEYLTGTGLKGGPLVVGPDETNSDLRLFSSDGNDTIIAMSTPQSFQDTCFNIFEKMLNTVPSAVTLSEPFLPRPWLLRFSKLDIDENGDVTFEGKITGHSSNPLPNTASYTYEKSTGGNTGTKTSDPGAVFPVPIGFGTIADFDFKDVLGDSDITSINIQGTYTSTINQKLFILPSQSFSNPESQNGGGIVRQKFILRAAVLSSLAPAGTVLTARIWYPQTQPNSVAPRIDSVTDVMTFKSTLGVYSIYHVVLEFGDGENIVANGAPVGHITLGNIQSSAKIELNNLHLNPCTEADLADC